MRKLKIECAAMLRIAIQQEIERSEESRYQHRLHALLLLAAGQSCRQVAEFFGEDDTTVQRWVHRFESGGIGALHERKRAGRPGRLSAEQWNELDEEPGRNPLEIGLGTARWDGPSLSQHLRHRYGVTLGVRQCQRIVRQLNFSPRLRRAQAA